MSTFTRRQFNRTLMASLGSVWARDVAGNRASQANQPSRAAFFFTRGQDLAPRSPREWLPHALNSSYHVLFERATFGQGFDANPDCFQFARTHLAQFETRSPTTPFLPVTGISQLSGVTISGPVFCFALQPKLRCNMSPNESLETFSFAVLRGGCRDWPLRNEVDFAWL